MGKSILKTFVYYILFIVISVIIHLGVLKRINISENSLFIIKLYAIIGLLTLLILIIGVFIKIKFPNYVGFAFMGGMTAKMSIVLALVVVNEQIKQNIVQLMIVYFVILFIEVISFTRLVKIK